jgi:ABC-type sugar transport system ATPase subunit
VADRCVLSLLVHVLYALALMAFLTASGISKRFGVTQALDNVSVEFARGEVHALMGENGAGKSTLGKAIAGLYTPDAGRVVLDCRELKLGNMDDCFAAGVRLVHQELAQCPNLSVAENLCLHDVPRNALGIVDFRAMRERASRLVHALDPSIDVKAPLGNLSPGRRQICQIAGALDEQSKAGKPKVIVLDEPTSSLSVAEADKLLAIVRRLAADGITIIYVSHRMGEIFQVCDRVTVLRDGKFVATNVVKEIDEPTLVQQMIGRRIETAKNREFGSPLTSEQRAAQPVMLRVEGLRSDRLKDVSLAVRKGEVVGLGGLVGCGRSELLNAIFGLDSSASGRVEVDGKAIDTSTPDGAIASRVGYVPEDRRNQGLFFLMGVGENMVLPFMGQLASALGVRSNKAEKGVIEGKIRDYRVKTASAAHTPGTLSGGNQQKLLIARWLSDDTKVVLLDEPTRGIDVGTKNEVYRLVREAANKGLAVLLVSSEMPELLALSDRVLVMCDGRISAELSGAEMTQENILRFATIDELEKARAVRAGA